MSQNQKQVRPLRFIRKNFDWERYVENNYDVKYAGDAEFRINCPSCNDTKHKCYVNVDKKVFHCFKCTFTTRKGAYDCFDFVALTEGIGKGAAIMKLLREYKPVTPDDLEAAMSGELDAAPEQVKKFKHPYLTRMPEVSDRLEVVPTLSRQPTDTRSTPEEFNPFWQYLIGRGLMPEEITKMMQTHVVVRQSHVIYGHNGKRKGDIGRRILWPIYGGDNKLVSWQARCFENPDDVKYFNAPDTDISGTLWPYVPPHPGSTVVLGEGIIDAVALRRLPKEYSGYATFSKHISKDQIALLKFWGVKRVILFWDNDAKKDMRKAVKELQLHFEALVPRTSEWPDDFDCGDCLKVNGVQYLCKAVEEAISVNSLDYVKWEIV